MSYKERTYVTKAADFPKTGHYAVLEYGTISVPTRQDDGVGTDPEPIAQYIAFADDVALKEWIKGKRSGTYSVFKTLPVQVETEIILK